MGVTQYGQMTAGSYSYIGPQGIVHGTVITVLNAARKYLNVDDDLGGKVLITSGLGGMSGAQAKVASILGCIVVVAEVCKEALQKRYLQGWLMEMTSNLDECLTKIREAKRSKKPLSLGYYGNVVDLWESLAKVYEETGELLPDLGSDQTSCHNIDGGGYCPVGLTYEECNRLMNDYADLFKVKIRDSLLRQINAINVLTKAGMRFWDYGNAFLLECSRAGADVKLPNDFTNTKFIYPSYMQDIMGDIFSMGFGPFRWICCSNDASDLETADQIALNILKKLAGEDVPPEVKQQYTDNIKWVANAGNHNLVVGSQARILYSDQRGRSQIALAFNKAVADGQLKGPVVISRDHHDVSGTDSPYRETSNIYDGSAFTADMAVQNFVGNSFRGATWVSLHNGGGVGWGDVINGGFGLVLDGSQDAENNARLVLGWDVWNGVTRRCWSGNPLAYETIERSMRMDPNLHITLPHFVEDEKLLLNF